MSIGTDSAGFRPETELICCVLYTIFGSLVYLTGSIRHYLLLSLLHGELVFLSNDDDGSSSWKVTWL